MNLKELGLRNNILMAPIKTGYNSGNGKITERHIAFWKARSKDVGAVILEPFYLNKNVRELPTQIGIDADDKIEGHKKLVEVIQNYGAKAIAQINHAGRMANPKLPNNIFISASEVQCPNGGPIPKSLTVEEIRNVQQLFIDGAIRAEKAGYDILELQFGLGYLISQFISLNTNKRNDEYGGSLENRMKFGLEILRGIQQKVKLPIIVRISGDEMHPEGMNINDTLEIVKILEKENIAAFHVTSGNVCLTPPWYYQHHFIPKGKNWEMAKKIKVAANIPVIAVGQINEFEDIDTILNEGYADFISLGRALIADPDFAGKYFERENNYRPCSACLTGCLGRIKIGKGLQCEINPLVGRELEELKPTDKIKNYAVVGGGLAGMESALALTQRGHKVTLFEKNELGGQFIYAPKPSQKSSLQKQIDFYLHELIDTKIIKKEISAEDLIGNYDGAIIATGSELFVPPIPGLKNYYWAEILNKENMPKDKNVLVIGGGLIGVEIANTLVDYNNKVKIVELFDEIARDMEMITRKLNLMKLQKNKVEIYTKTRVTSIDGSTVRAEKMDEINEKYKFYDIDIIVLATGMKPVNKLAESLQDKIPVYTVGDAKEIGDAVTAIQSAYFTCKEL